VPGSGTGVGAGEVLALPDAAFDRPSAGRLDDGSSCEPAQGLRAPSELEMPAATGNEAPCSCPERPPPHSAA
jgi:hypothetical protein